MRESYRDKRNRQARIAKEKKDIFEERRKEERRKNEHRKEERRKEKTKVEFERRKTEKRTIERRVEKRREEYRVEDNSYEDVIAGRNAVMELLKSSKDINKIFIERGEKHGSINEIIARAKEAKIVTVEVEKSKLDQMAENHQGVVAIVPPFNTE